MAIPRSRFFRRSLASLAFAAGVMVTGPALGDNANAPEAEKSTVIRDGFESARTIWNQEHTDTTITLHAHDRSNRAAHELRTSEHFHFTAGLGSGYYFSYQLPKVPVTDELRASLFVRANRAGVQLFLRVILPADTDPESGQPSFLLVPGTIFDNVDRWQRLEVLDLRASMERQARILRATKKRPVSLEGAYVEQVIVNLFAGAGETEVFLDELSVGPVPAELAASHAERINPRNDIPGVGGSLNADANANDTRASTEPKDRHAQGPIKIELNRLKKRALDRLYHDWVFTGIHAPGADVLSLRNVAFDVLIDDLDADSKRFKAAVDAGFLLMPRVTAGRKGEPVDPEQVVATAAAFSQAESVMGWDLGEHLGRAIDPQERREELSRVRTMVTKMRTLPAGVSHLTTGLIDDDLARYARRPQNLEIFGIKPMAWGGSMSPLETFTFLRQRRDLTLRNNPGAFFWALLPAAAPQAVPINVWGFDTPPAGAYPQVQPEQIRLFTYATLAAGYRGLAFQGDAELTRGSGRMLLLEMALLNAEIDMCESILANGSDPIPIYAGFDPDPPTIPPPGGAVNKRIKSVKELLPHPTIRAAAIGTRDRKGVLLLIADYAANAQFQPTQMARNKVNLTVIVPEGAQAFEVAPGRFKPLEEQPERLPGGTRISIPEFDTTAMFLVTNDLEMAKRVEIAVNSIAPRAALIAIEQAELKHRWVSEIHGRLAAEGHYLIQEKERAKREVNGGSLPTDAADLLATSASNIKTARENLERLDYSNAWAEARRASRPLRILMSGLWQNAFDAMVRANTPDADLANEEAIKTNRVKRVGPRMILPVTASPPLVAFNTLPQHYVWVDWMKTAHFGRNLIPSGSFDQPDSLLKSGWTNESYQYEGVSSKVTTTPNGNDGRKRILKITVEQAVKEGSEVPPPFLDFPAAAIRSPAISVKTGQFLRISVYVQRSVASAAGAGGVIVRDSIGGEALQFASTAPIPGLTKVIMYRRAPADGELTVTLGLAGYGEAFFDELTVERVEAASAPPDVARNPRPRQTAAAPTANGAQAR